MSLSVTYYPDINEYGKAYGSDCDYALPIMVREMSRIV